MITNRISKWLYLVVLGIVASLSCGSDDGEAPRPEIPVVSGLELTVSESFTVAGHNKPVLLLSLIHI